MLTECIHDDMPMADYVADPCPQPSLSAGAAQRIVTSSPAHAYLWHPRLGGKISSSRLADFGSAAHAWLSGDDKVNVIGEVTKANGDVITPTDYKTRAAREARDAIYEADGIPLLAHEVEAVKTARDAAAKALARFGSGQFEQTVIWREGDVWCRARPDFLTDDYVVDLKTCPNAHPSVWQRTLYGSGHETRAALYLRGLFRLTGQERDYVFLAQEREEPYACSLIGVGPRGRDLGEAKVKRAIELWGECLQTNRWPGYPTDIVYADPPTWALWQAEDNGIHLED